MTKPLRLLSNGRLAFSDLVRQGVLGDLLQGAAQGPAVPRVVILTAAGGRDRLELGLGLGIDVEADGVQLELQEQQPLEQEPQQEQLPVQPELQEELPLRK